jgi:hypothetical protein
MDADAAVQRASERSVRRCTPSWRRMPPAPAAGVETFGSCGHLVSRAVRVVVAAWVHASSEAHAHLERVRPLYPCSPPPPPHRSSCPGSGPTSGARSASARCEGSKQKQSITKAAPVDSLGHRRNLVGQPALRHRAFIGFAYPGRVGTLNTKLGVVVTSA